MGNYSFKMLGYFFTTLGSEKKLNMKLKYMLHLSRGVFYRVFRFMNTPQRELSFIIRLNIMSLKDEKNQ